MTTNPQPMPYDAEIDEMWAVLEGRSFNSPYTALSPESLQAMIAANNHRRTGYLRAKAEDADLLTACEGVKAALRCPTCDDGECSIGWHNALTSAIARAGGGTP